MHGFRARIGGPEQEQPAGTQNPSELAVQCIDRFGLHVDGHVAEQNEVQAGARLALGAGPAGSDLEARGLRELARDQA